MKEESEVMKSKIHELELHCASILEKNLMQTKEIENLVAEKTEMRSKFEALMHDNVSLRESLERSVENLKKKPDVIKASIPELEFNSVSTILEKNLKQMKEIKNLNKTVYNLKKKYGEIKNKNKEMAKLDKARSDTLTKVTDFVKYYQHRVNETDRKMNETDRKMNEMSRRLIILAKMVTIGYKKSSSVEQKTVALKNVISNLESEIVNYKLSIEKITLERDDFRKELDLKNAC